MEDALWNQTPLPWKNFQEYEVRLHGMDEIRRVRWQQGNGLLFTDCTHPMQNIICDREKIQVWRERAVDKQ